MLRLQKAVNWQLDMKGQTSLVSGEINLWIPSTTKYLPFLQGVKTTGDSENKDKYQYFSKCKMCEPTMQLPTDLIF